MRSPRGARHSQFGRLDSAACSDSFKSPRSRRANQPRSGQREQARVLISGAGIAGLTVAWSLRRYGFTTTIVERAPSLLTGGHKIDVRGTALQVLRRMGIHDAVVAASTDMVGALLVDGEGKVLNRMSGMNSDIASAKIWRSCRGTLRQILKDHISDAEFIFGDQFRPYLSLPTASRSRSRRTAT